MLNRSGQSLHEKCLCVSIGRGLKDSSRIPHCQKLNPHRQDIFRSGQCQADFPTVRNFSHWAKVSLGPLPMDKKRTSRGAASGCLGLRFAGAWASLGPSQFSRSQTAQAEPSATPRTGTDTRPASRPRGAPRACGCSSWRRWAWSCAPGVACRADLTAASSSLVFHTHGLNKTASSRIRVFRVPYGYGAGYV